MSNGRRTRLLLIVTVLFLSACRLSASSRPLVVTFNAQTYKGQTGKVTVPLQGAVQLIASQPIEDGRLKYIILRGSDGAVICPAGTYRLLSLSITPSREQQGDGIQMMSFRLAASTNHLTTSDGRRIVQSIGMRGLTIAAGQTVDIDVGPPYTAQTSAMAIERDGVPGMSISLDIKDRNGAPVAFIGNEPPGFEIVSKEGKTLMTGEFAYG